MCPIRTTSIPCSFISKHLRVDRPGHEIPSRNIVLLVVHHTLSQMTNPPVFPLELERAIFMAAAIIHEEPIPTLLRVAHRVLVWQVHNVVVAERHC